MKNKAHLLRDLEIIFFSIVAAFVISKFGIIDDFLVWSQEWRYLGVFVAGVLFTSVSTIAPALVILGKISQTEPVFLVASLGAAGALCADLIIFQFIKDRLADDLAYLLKASHEEKWLALFHRRIFKRIIPFIGAFFVVSPLPDDLGISMMGLSKMKSLTFIPLAYALHFLGILFIGFLYK